MLRTLVVGALSAVALTAFAASDTAFAAKKMCKSVDKPQCNLVLRAECTKQNKCGCQKWVCKL